MQLFVTKEMVYLGETKRQFKFCLVSHRGYVVNKHTNQATGLHFNLPGHSLADISATGIEIINKSEKNVRNIISKVLTPNKMDSREKHDT